MKKIKFIPILITIFTASILLSVFAAFSVHAYKSVQKDLEIFSENILEQGFYLSKILYQAGIIYTYETVERDIELVRKDIQEMKIPMVSHFNMYNVLKLDNLNELTGISEIFNKSRYDILIEEFSQEFFNLVNSIDAALKVQDVEDLLDSLKQSEDEFMRFLSAGRRYNDFLMQFEAALFSQLRSGMREMNRRSMILIVLSIFSILCVIVIFTIFYRTNKSFQKSIEEAKIKAEEANELKLQFMANMSHELRTPLNGILGMASLLKGTELADKQQQYLHYMHLSAENLHTLIQDLLDFSRINAGKLVVMEDPLILSEVFEFTAEQIKSEIEEKGLTFKYTLDLPNEKILGDKVRLNQIVLNLLTNAIKFTEEGSITFTVMKKDDLLKIAVSDTGIGIDDSFQEKIFQSFVQLEDAYTKKHQGLGLGLAITGNLVMMMDGVLEVDSVPGKGSCFTVSLPYKVFL